MSDTPLVLVPGLLCTRALFQPQIEAVAGRAVMIADHQTDTTLDAIADRLLEMAPERFALAGLSMGGYVAMAVMRKAPQRVTRLMLLDTTARPDAPEQTQNRRRQMALAQDGRFDQILPALYPLFVHERREDDTALKAVCTRMAEETGPHAFVRQQEAILARPDARPHLPAIACPTTVVVGEGDRLTPPDRAHEMHELIAESRLEIVSDAGHLPTLEMPDTVTAIMRNWLR
ncbi:alpha/beta fold hydrolase [Stappia sp. ES.058]|uniref:alpha/beta fold hydrolase n=1 Tax=Stappia sp. ES.058 TaxID=1881061 RepID=UPI00087C1037|nr:alpha/beta fold hydrolase [Stappia sp. ES.058]SDU37664.1 Pimeloyl-ACP methyl ester carboxylesterase [Stappia sp. ES.058]